MRSSAAGVWPSKRKTNTGVTNAQFKIHLFRAAPATVTNGDNGVFSSGYSSVILLRKAYFPVTAIPLNSSFSKKLERKSFKENADGLGETTALVDDLGISGSN